jgi:hypothetical protein
MTDPTFNFTCVTSHAIPIVPRLAERSRSQTFCIRPKIFDRIALV